MGTPFVTPLSGDERFGETAAADGAVLSYSPEHWRPTGPQSLDPGARPIWPPPSTGSHPPALESMGGYVGISSAPPAEGPSPWGKKAARPPKSK